MLDVVRNIMPSPSLGPIIDLVGQFAAVLRSLQEFDDLEVLRTVKVMRSHSDRQKCFVGTYYRAVANVRTTLGLNNPSHFQAIAMLARTNIELAMDIKLLNTIDRPVEKMMAFADSEKLRTARKVVEYAARAGSSVPDVQTYERFIASREKDVVASRVELWGSPKPPEHWSSLKIRDRAVKLGAPFEELYEIQYRHLSWQVHAGLTSVFGVEPVTFAVMCGDALGIAVKCYVEVLTEMIRELGLKIRDAKILNRLELARLVAATSGAREAAQLRRELLREPILVPRAWLATQTI